MADTSVSANTKLPSQGHTPTALGILISGAKNCEQPVEILKWHTLNEKFGVKAAEAIGIKQGNDFKLGWFGIGGKGSRKVGENEVGLEVYRINQHRATDNAPFYAFPFCVRELGNDLNEEERRKYRMRVVRQIGSVTYVFYYLKAISFALYDPKVKTGYHDPISGTNKEDPYTPQESDLTPPPFEMSGEGTIPATDWYSTATGILDMTMEAGDLDELRNVARILWGDTSLARFNELYLAHGIDTVVPDGIGPNGNNIRYDELIPACASYLITQTTPYDANLQNRAKIHFNYGNSISYLTEVKPLSE